MFDRLREAKLCLKPKQCHFAKREALYLVYVLSQSGISADKSIFRSFLFLLMLKQIRFFVGLASYAYYRLLIPGFSKIAGPLFALAKKDPAFEWSSSY